jgi:hypothetical protein
MAIVLFGSIEIPDYYRWLVAGMIEICKEIV